MEVAMDVRVPRRVRAGFDRALTLSEWRANADRCDPERRERKQRAALRRAIAALDALPDGLIVDVAEYVLARMRR
jgi:hypothetical protein